MADLLPIQFDRPIWLWLLLLLIPVYLISHRSAGGGGLSRMKATVSFAFRTLIIFILSLVLAEPSWVRTGEGITTTIILDRSQSIPLPLKASSLKFLREAAEHKDSPDDRIAVITVAKDADIAAMPDKYSAVSAGVEPADLSATNLAAGVRLALAIMPEDTANRIVIASDGNETIDSVLAAADIAKANGVPVDVLVLEYEHANEVTFDRIVAPARARPGQSTNLKLVLRSQREASGTVSLTMNDTPIDLNGDAPGSGLAVQLEPGVKVIPLTIGMEEAGPQQFKAVFEPDNPEQDRIDRNNSALAVTFVGSAGKVLIIRDSPAESRHLLRVLKESEIAVEEIGPGALVNGLVQLAGYDAIVLANMPRWAFDDDQVRDLHSYVHDLGGGIVMLGGRYGFGAGGWIDTELAKAMPVDMQPPQSRQMPRGALALIMHSCEMAQGNFWGQKVAQAAINALSRLDYVGIVVFGWGGGLAAGGINGCTWAFPMQVVGNKSAAIAATKKMQVGDMPGFGPSMQLGLNGLTSIRAGQKHAIIISDGDPGPPNGKLLKQYIQSNITVTTIMVGGHGTAMDLNKMKTIANKTGGRFYNIKNPKKLPQIFIKEAQLISRTLIQEDLFQPQVISRLPGPVEGFLGVPTIQGYVLTAAREGLAQTPIVVATEEGNDPIYAHWNYGLGKSIAYTSDLTSTWGTSWVAWDRFRSFWEQSIRWVMRPSSPTNLLVNTRREGGRAIVEMEALEADASFVNFLKTSAVVIGPDHEPAPLVLQQVGPGRYRGEFPVGDAGAYLVNINYSAPSEGAMQQGNIQAAVTVPYSREYRAVKHNAATLLHLADKTGGRQLSAVDPLLVNLFEKEGLEPPRTLKDVWDLLVILAASLFVLDVASRRLSIDPEWVRGIMNRLTGKRRVVGQDTVAAWKRAKSQASHKTKSQPSEPQRGQRSVKFEASEEDAAIAIDAGGDSPADLRGKEGKATRKTKVRTGDDSGGGGEEDFTSRLLAAKRRAMQETDEGDPGDDSQ